MKKLIFIFGLLTVIMLPSAIHAQSVPFIEVTGSATLNIVPNRITVRIKMEEYYRRDSKEDSVLVGLAHIDKLVRKTLAECGVADSMITVFDYGNFIDKRSSRKFLMASVLNVTLTDFKSLERISSKLPKYGISSFEIAGIDNTEMSEYNRKGLKSALDAARSKAGFIAENEGVKIVGILEIIESGPNYYSTPVFSNVAYENGRGMDDMRKIVRLYSVRVKYGIK